MTYLKNSRRDFLKGLTATSVLSATSIPVIATSIADQRPIEDSPGTVAGTAGGGETLKPAFYDGPQSPLFNTLSYEGNSTFLSLRNVVSKEMENALEHAPKGEGTAWGIPFHISDQPILLKDKAYDIQLASLKTNWLVFLHTSDSIHVPYDKDTFYKAPFRGRGQLNEDVADYIIRYADGTEVRVPVRERHQIGMFRQGWGENSIQSVAHHKPIPVRAHHEQRAWGWGGSQTRVDTMDRGNWINWLYAWENPNPSKQITGIRFEPKNVTHLLISAISAGKVFSNPLRWEVRKKALLKVPKAGAFNHKLDEEGLLTQLKLDLGQVISATPRLKYPKENWATSYDNKLPEVSEDEVLIEYTAHPEARFHLETGETVAVADMQENTGMSQMRSIPPSGQWVKFRVVEKGTGKPVPVKIHVHGESGEYLAPVDRHRIPNGAWFEDYSVDYLHDYHTCTYISGETHFRLPLGKVYVEVSKGFEIKPIRKVVSIAKDTDLVEMEIEKVLAWREKGWVSADTHVHFLSPHSALLEGSGEGVNIINLLASQWGELFTNIGDFDGKTTVGSVESGGDGEYLVPVGTENRQHVMGHISLLGYNGDIITPLTTGGAEESALGDPIEMLLTEWAEQCKKQDGLVVLPHFPDPRLENAASIVSGNVDGVEMTSWGGRYWGISAYSLADWYRYLNCGYFVAAVGGTDKMSAKTAVGIVRTYARIRDNHPFSYDEWKEAVRRGETFVSYGPLLNFSVDGKPMGSRIDISSRGGTVDISWDVASVTIPLSRVDLIANGEVVESTQVTPYQAKGSWRVKVEKSSWYALLVRGHYPDKPEIITAHSSPVMISVEGTQMLAAADALTILEQIEGALAYMETIGTRADDKTYKRMRLKLEWAHRTLHNRMHQQGHYHKHSPTTDHSEHHST